MNNKHFLYTFIIGIIFMSYNCKKAETEPKEISFLVGTYTTNTDSEGIYEYMLFEDGTMQKGKQVAVTTDPSFITYTKDRKYLVAVNETNSGEISSFEVTKEGLKKINKVPSGGAHPCHVVIDENGYVLVSNYTGGNLSLTKIDNGGRLTALDVQQHEGKGAHPRQEKPHVHSSWLHDDSVIAVDLGTNTLNFSTINRETNKLELREQSSLHMEEQAGPRHLTIHPKNSNWLYVLNELNSTVTLVKKEDGVYKKVNSITTIPDEFKENNQCADIHMSSDGMFLYASNRGHNSIAIYKVNQNDGTLDLIGHESVKGNWPRNFALSPDGKFVLVANQYSNNMVSFKRDSDTGLLSFVSEVEAPAPVCILF